MIALVVLLLLLLLLGGFGFAAHVLWFVLIAALVIGRSASSSVVRPTPRAADAAAGIAGDGRPGAPAGAPPAFSLPRAEPTAAMRSSAQRPPASASRARSGDRRGGRGRDQPLDPLARGLAHVVPDGSACMCRRRRHRWRRAAWRAWRSARSAPRAGTARRRTRSATVGQHPKPVSGRIRGGRPRGSARPVSRRGSPASTAATFGAVAAIRAASRRGAVRRSRPGTACRTGSSRRAVRQDLGEADVVAADADRHHLRVAVERVELRRVRAGPPSVWAGACRRSSRRCS